MKHSGRVGMVWRKSFVAGAILEGLNVWERMEFIDRWHCAQWLKGVRRNIRRGVLEWRFDGRPTIAMVVRSTPQCDFGSAWCRAGKEKGETVC